MSEKNFDRAAAALHREFILTDEEVTKRGGSMDFWDNLSPHDKALCVRLLDDIIIIMNSAGRARP